MLSLLLLGKFLVVVVVVVVVVVFVVVVVVVPCWLLCPYSLTRSPLRRPGSADIFQKDENDR